VVFYFKILNKSLKGVLVVIGAMNNKPLPVQLMTPELLNSEVVGVNEGKRLVMSWFEKIFSLI
jgi:hypothetical protein